MSEDKGRYVRGMRSEERGRYVKRIEVDLSEECQKIKVDMSEEQRQIYQKNRSRGREERQVCQRREIRDARDRGRSTENDA